MKKVAQVVKAKKAAKKIKKAKTDAEPLPSEVAGLKDRPEVDNLVGIYASLADVTKQAVLDENPDAKFGTFKTALAKLAFSVLFAADEAITTPSRLVVVPTLLPRDRATFPVRSPVAMMVLITPVAPDASR